MKKITTEQFIIRSQQKHGDYYDYSNTVLGGMKEHVTIICPVHGEFSQIAESPARRGLVV